MLTCQRPTPICCQEDLITYFVKAPSPLQTFHLAPPGAGMELAHPGAKRNQDPGRGGGWRGGAGCYPAPWHQKVKHISASFGLHVTTRLMDNGQHKEAHAKDQPSMGRRTNPRKRQAWSWGTAQHSTARQSTAQHSTVRHSTASSRHSGRAVPDAERQSLTALLPERRPGAPPGAAHPLCQRLQRSLTPWAQSSAKHPGMKGKKKNNNAQRHSSAWEKTNKK